MSISNSELMAALARARAGIGAPSTAAAPTPLERALAEQVERLRLAAGVFERCSEGVVITDPGGRIVDVNPAFVAITGYTREQAVGRSPSLLSSGRHDRAFYEQMWRTLRQTGQWSGEVWNRRADGELFAELLRISAVHAPGGELTHYVGLISDLTHQKRDQEMRERLLHQDALTGLPNRALMLDRLAVMVAAAARQGRRLAVCYLDLDAFHEFNARLGHPQGDELLVQAARHVREALPASATVARPGGDEFVLLLGEVERIADVDLLLTRVQRALELAAPPGQGALTGSIGVAVYPEHGDTPDRLMRAAHQAMYRAKRLGRNRACIAGEEAERPLAQEALLEELAAALAAGELCLHYQPKVCARTRRPAGAEALLRWQHPRRGLLAPGAFLPAVVGTPLEVELDQWVLRSAVAQLARWRAQGCLLPLSVNVSPRTLVRPGFAATVAALLRASGLGHDGALGLEVLETAAVDDFGAASGAIEACAQQGIGVALDDFGTGYSSLSYLRRLPVDCLKIDRGFVAGMLDDAGDLHIVRAVIGLAAAFGVETVAEGVETAAHAAALTELGCGQLQGYGIARPMPAAQLEAWLERQPGCATAAPPASAGA